jgi:glucose-6-phosphate isomerase
LPSSSELLQLLFKRRDRLLEHRAVRRGSRGSEIRPRAIQRQLDRPALRLRLSLLRRQRASRLRSAALGLGLLKFDVFAFETPSHSKYCIGMPPLDVTALRARVRSSFRYDPGTFASAVSDADRVARGLWRRDPATWSADPGIRRKIADRLGWLTSPSLMADSIDRLRTFADSIKSAGFNDIVLLGMGGSSLAPETMRAILGVAPGRPRFHMLDSTDPAAVIAAATPPGRTLYVLASKSGTTIEPNCLAAHFRSRLESAGVMSWADHFVAITDEGTELSRRARDERFRDLFINPSDIGGRYSAVSFFGMVPAALMGQDLTSIVGWSLAMLAECDPDVNTAAQNPAVALGLAIGAAVRSGRDKLTLVVPPSLEPFGLWVEQLIAESTGKQGTGAVPIAGEPVGDAAVYGSDRLFVRLRTSEPDGADATLTTLKSRGAPVLEIDWPEPAAIGAEFLRWEVATAVAGGLLNINPFDEPNVQQAKDATKKLLDMHQKDGRFPASTPDATRNGVALTLSGSARNALAGRGAEALLTTIKAGDYFTLLAYLGPDPAIARALAAVRRSVRDRTHTATMLGYGPRYLHSTGQLHKGGPNSGVFVLISATPSADAPIPGQPFSFATLEYAQALGDFQSLDASGRRALHAHLPTPDARTISALGDALLAAL